jgi:hypothetical protein
MKRSYFRGNDYGIDDVSYIRPYDGGNERLNRSSKLHFAERCG